VPTTRKPPENQLRLGTVHAPVTFLRCLPKRPDGLGRHGQGELRGTAVLPQTTLGQSSIAPWTDLLLPGEKKRN
jgi:hypothetical protein